MTVADLLYSKVYAQQQTPEQADLLCTQKYWSLYTSIDNQWVCSCKDSDGKEKLCSTLDPSYISSTLNADSSNKCENLYGSFHVGDGPEWCLCKDSNNKEVLCKDMSQSWLDRLCANDKNGLNTRNKQTEKCECTTYVKNSDGTIREPKECLVNKAGSVGIKCTAQDLINNTCSRNINKTLGFRTSDTTPNPTLLLQDVVLGATSFVGTIIMVALVYLGFKAILKWTDDADALWDIKSKAKNLIIWFLLVIGSYTIIRLVQYIARGF